MDHFLLTVRMCFLEVAYNRSPGTKAFRASAVPWKQSVQILSLLVASQRTFAIIKSRRNILACWCFQVHLWTDKFLTRCELTRRDLLQNCPEVWYYLRTVRQWVNSISGQGDVDIFHVVDMYEDTYFYLFQDISYKTFSICSTHKKTWKKLKKEFKDQSIILLCLAELLNQIPQEKSINKTQTRY